MSTTTYHRHADAAAVPAVPESRGADDPAIRALRLAQLETHLLGLREPADGRDPVAPRGTALAQQVMARVEALPAPRPLGWRQRLRRLLPGGGGRSGFTLIELLVVLAVIAALAGMTFPAVGALRARQAGERTQATVQILLSAMSNYGRAFITVPDGRTMPLWDFNQDGLIDGDPERDPGFDPALRTAARGVGYRGPAAQLNVNLRPGSLDAERRICDGWGRPLHLSRAATIYGALGIGLWSEGRDGLPGTPDDITSWSRTDAP